MWNWYRGLVSHRLTFAYTSVGAVGGQGERIVSIVLKLGSSALSKSRLSLGNLFLKTLILIGGNRSIVFSRSPTSTSIIWIYFISSAVVAYLVYLRIAEGIVIWVNILVISLQGVLINFMVRHVQVSFVISLLKQFVLRWYNLDLTLLSILWAEQSLFVRFWLIFSHIIHIWQLGIASLSLLDSLSQERLSLMVFKLTSTRNHTFVVIIIIVIGWLIHSLDMLGRNTTLSLSLGIAVDEGRLSEELIITSVVNGTHLEGAHHLFILIVIAFSVAGISFLNNNFSWLVLEIL